MKIAWITAGAIVSAAVTVILIFITAAAQYYTGLPEGVAQICAYGAAVIGVFTGSLIAARKAQGRVLIHAMAVAFIYIAALIIASFAVNGKINTDIHCISIMAGVMMSGFLGAVCGRR